MEMHDKNICEIKEALSSMLRTYMARDISQVDTEEAYKIADIIKDMAEAEMYEAKKAYVTAMEDYDEDEMRNRMKSDITVLMNDMNAPAIT